MRTLYAMLVSLAMPVALVSLCLLLAPSALIKFGGILVVLFFFGILIPITLDEAGLFFSWYLKIYPVGTFLSKSSILLYKVPIWRNPNYGAFAPMNLSLVFLATGKKKEAKLLAREALSTSHAANWRVQFRCRITLGEIQYHIDEPVEAKLNLLKAKELYDSNFDSDPASGGAATKTETMGIDEELKQYYAKCLDLLGLLLLMEGNYDESQNYFSQGVYVRHNSETLKPTAKAYKQYVDGLLLLSRDSSDQQIAEEKILEAADLLPGGLKLMQDHYVLISVSRALAELRSNAAVKAKSGFKKAYAGKLHSYQMKLLDRPIFS